MKNNDDPLPEVKDLIDQFLDGTISDESMSVLDRLLDGSQSTRSFFLRYCQMHIELRTDAAVDERAEKVFGAFCERKDRVTASVETTKTNSATPPVSHASRHFPFLSFGSDFGG